MKGIILSSFCPLRWFVVGFRYIDFLKPNRSYLWRRFYVNSSLILLPCCSDVDLEELGEVVDIGRVGGLSLAPLHLQVVLFKQDRFNQYADHAAGVMD